MYIYAWQKNKVETDKIYSIYLVSRFLHQDLMQKNSTVWLGYLKSEEITNFRVYNSVTLEKIKCTKRKKN